MNNQLIDFVMLYRFIGLIVLLILVFRDNQKNRQSPRPPRSNYNDSYYYHPGNQNNNFVGYRPNPYNAKNYNPSEESGFKEPDIYPYYSKNLLTPTEHQFYIVLKRKCDPRGITICPKVRLEDFVEVRTQNNRLKYRGYIRSRHVDFILLDRQQRIIAGIELDDSSHNTHEARKIDTFKNNLFRVINIPLHRVPVGHDYENAADGILRAYEMFGC